MGSHNTFLQCHGSTVYILYVGVSLRMCNNQISTQPRIIREWMCLSTELNVL